jgi:hypothetical protein
VAAPTAVEATATPAAEQEPLASVGVETNRRRGVVDLDIAGRLAFGRASVGAGLLNRTETSFVDLGAAVPLSPAAW